MRVFDENAPSRGAGKIERGDIVVEFDVEMPAPGSLTTKELSVSNVFSVLSFYRRTRTDAPPPLPPPQHPT